MKIAITAAFKNAKQTHPQPPSQRLLEQGQEFGVAPFAVEGSAAEADFMKSP